MRHAAMGYLGLIGVLLLAAGCGQPKAKSVEGEPAPTSNYRTITATPLRDTEAARRLHEQGLKHLEADRVDEAEKAFQQALEADVDYGPAHNNLGKVYFRKKDWYAAAWEFEYAKKLMPRQAEPWNNLGLVYEQAGELDRAVEEYRKAVGMDNQQMEYQANLARALVRRGERSEELTRLLQAIVERDTRPEWVDWARQQLAR